MDSSVDQDPEFTIVHETDPGETVIAGFSQFGLAGLTAVDYLVDHLELEEYGYLTSDHFPSITPFEEGRPRHHTQLFSRPGLDFTILVGELFVPLPVAREFGNTVVDWMADSNVQEAAILSGVPISHGPDAHQVFYVATDDYHERRLTETSMEGMRKGYLDGINAAILERAISGPPRVGVYVTPVHEKAPDVEAALRLLNALDSIYDIDVDTGPLEAFAEEVSQYYENLEERFRSASQNDLPEDRMYM